MACDIVKVTDSLALRVGDSGLSRYRCRFINDDFPLIDRSIDADFSFEIKANN